MSSEFLVQLFAGIADAEKNGMDKNMHMQIHTLRKILAPNLDDQKFFEIVKKVEEIRELMEG